MDSPPMHHQHSFYLLLNNPSFFSFFNAQTSPYVTSWNVGGGSFNGYCRTSQRGDYLDSYILINSVTQLGRPTTTGFTMGAFQMNWNGWGGTNYQVLFIRGFAPPTVANGGSITLSTTTSSVETTPFTLPNFYCTPFKNLPLKIKNNIVNYDAIFNPRSTRSLFNVEFDGVPIDNIGCQAVNGQFDCACSPYDLSYLTGNADTPLIVRCSLAPRPAVFNDWNSTVVKLFDTVRTNITSVNVTVRFPGMLSSSVETTTLVTSILAQPANNTMLNFNYGSSYVDLYVNVAAKNSELIMYKASVSGVVPTIGADPYATYKSILGSNDNVLIHFTFPVDTPTLSPLPIASPTTSTVMFVLTSKSFLPSYHSLYPYQNSLDRSYDVFTVNSSFCVIQWNLTSPTPYISIQPNVNFQPTVPTLYAPFPFGLVRGTPSGSFANASPYQYSYGLGYVQNFNIRTMLPHKELVNLFSGPFNSVATTPTPLYTLSVRKLSSFQMILQYSLKQDAVGFSGGYIPLSSTYGISLPIGDSVASTEVYEYEVNITRTNYGNYWQLYIMSMNGVNQTLYKQGDILGATADSVNFVPPLPGLLSYTVSDIVELYWSPATVDVTNGPAKSTIYYKLSSNFILDQNERPAVLIYQIHKSNADDLSQYFVGRYEDGYLKVEVEIKERSYPGSVVYYLATASFNIFGELIATNPLIGQKNATLTVTCQYADEMGPVVRSVQAYQSSISAGNQNQTASMQWDLKIEDQPTGLYLAKSYAIITTNLDPTPRPAKLEQISGTDFSGMYRVEYSTTSGPSLETFKLDLILTDYLGNEASSLVDVSGKDMVNVDPFLYIVNTPANQNRFVNVSYPQVVDITPPDLVKFAILSGSQLDVSNYDRTLQFVFSLKDDQSGVSITSNPTVYVTSPMNGMFSCVGVIVTQSNPTNPSNTGVVTYNCNITLPYGYGARSTGYISIYGYSNNNRVFGGYDSNTLGSIGQNTVSFVMNNLDPVILSTSGLSGKLAAGANQSVTVRGRKFCNLNDYNNTMITLYVNDNSSTSIVPTFVSATVLVFSASFDPKINSYSLTIIRPDSEGSNVFAINYNTVSPPVRPTQPPIPTSKPVACPTGPSSSLPCSGNGICDVSTGKCTCTGNFAGDDCSATRSNNTDTNVDPKEPTTTTNTSSVITGVSVIEVQEMNINDQVVARYPLGKWQFTNSSDENSFVYVYSTIFANTSVGNSSIVVRVQYFLEDSQVSFGGQNISMPTGTVKYTITLSQYNFASLLGQLRVIMRVDAGLETDDACLSVNTNNQDESAIGDSIDWIKLQVNDKVLYGRFVSVGYIDGRLQTVGNSLVSQNTTGQTASTLLGIDIPYYQYSSIVDPDFSVLTSIDDRNGCSSNDEFWTTGKLIAVILSCVAGAAVLSFIAFMVIKRKLKYRYRIMMEGRKHKRALDKSGELDSI
ncbi:hypothetical protein DFA_06553 [Cavenderia fasciculata]|uniref:EGF-like domain-containing protein n=1 Tax=Cavenderia fasciculata TaxID=261658 RepID=F4PJB7_CACFS|nr:uncharacterized protein DFA_06553 [Cavenderia fasciculata]EGG24403.1 hypothetical protein DFA_06553 [Cavenderia fasciculata]|eukprot:XP_004362254.1 hypothetical protein DFA_06553 [Cavenderia fasciculata]